MKISFNKNQPVNRIFSHILFWLFSFFIFSQMFKISDDVKRIDYIYSGLFHVSLLFGVYVNIVLLIPKLLSKKKYLVYFIALVATIFLSITLNLITFDWLADIVFPDYYFVSHFNFMEIGMFIFVYILITTLLRLSQSWFELQEVNKRIVRIEKENIKSELNALKAQINPHFLFNSLNVIYSQAIKNSDKTPDAIIQLSDILRYVIYDSTKDKVSLKTEIKLIEDYIELQKFRIDITSSIKFEHKLQDENCKITPMLLLPLVENSFKHGIKGELDHTFVNIKLETNNNNILFEIVNNKGTGETIENDGNSGIGIANIRQRLNLLYPNKHEFNIEESTTIFKANMILDYES
jgi:sensor histidine kinase YesM